MTAARKLLNLTDGNLCTVIIGTEKNAGKTTALNALLGEAEGVIGVTGIGRDGESSDLVTGTEKPKIFVKKGTLVATAKGLIKECSVSKRILYATGITTPLGEVVVFRVEEEGFVQVAGPSIVSQLVSVKNLLSSLGAEKVLVDGALERKTFSACSLADAVILVTGASATPDMYEAADNAAFIASTFFYPTTDGDIEMPTENARGYLKNKDLGNGEALALIEDGADELRLSGALTDSLLNKLCTYKRRFSVTVSDPGKIVASRKTAEKFLNKGNLIYVTRRPRLLAVCVNPHSVRGYRYDAEEYLKAVAERVTVPVFDVVN